MAQRIMQSQAALQLSVSAPQIYDMKVLHRQMLESMGVKNVDEIIKPDEGEIPADPVQENMNAVNMKPIKAFSYQDHDAHITAHMTFMQSPAFMGLEKTPMFPAIAAAMDAHIREHIAFQYRQKIEQEIGVPLPPDEEILPKDVEKRISGLIAAASTQMLNKETAQMQAQKNMAAMQDPIVQQKEKELQIRAMQAQNKMQVDMAKLQLDAQKARTKDAIEIERINAQERMARQAVEQRILDTMVDAQVEKSRIDSQELQKGVEIGFQAGRNRRE
jgi:hypothetical protein